MHRLLEPSERDWKKDFPLENGNYLNTCIYCENGFRGHKNRVVCLKCWNLINKSKDVRQGRS